MDKKRCSWCNMKNPKYIEYHDKEWCVPNFDDKYLYEMLILESFQAGLSWECVLNKREAFRKAYDDFDIEKVCLYDENKINEYGVDKYYAANAGNTDYVEKKLKEAGFKNPNTSDDLYIINEKTYTIYYVKGIELNEKLLNTNACR